MTDVYSFLALQPRAFSTVGREQPETLMRVAKTYVPRADYNKYMLLLSRYKGVCARSVEVNVSE